MEQMGEKNQHLFNYELREEVPVTMTAFQDETSQCIPPKIFLPSLVLSDKNMKFQAKKD